MITALAHFQARRVWHSVFDAAPLTQERLGHDASPLIRDFIASCRQQRIALDWRRHVHWLRWLEQQGRHTVSHEPAVRKELLAACASAWAHDGYIDPDASRIVIADPLTAQALSACRPSRFAERVRVCHVRCELPDSGPILCYRTLAAEQASPWHAL